MMLADDYIEIKQKVFIMSKTMWVAGIDRKAEGTSECSVHFIALISEYSFSLAFPNSIAAPIMEAPARLQTSRPDNIYEMLQQDFRRTVHTSILNRYRVAIDATTVAFGRKPTLQEFLNVIANKKAINSYEINAWSGLPLPATTEALLESLYPQYIPMSAEELETKWYRNLPPTPWVAYAGEQESDTQALDEVVMSCRHLSTRFRDFPDIEWVDSPTTFRLD